MFFLSCLITTVFLKHCWVPSGLSAPPGTANPEVTEVNRFDPSQIEVGDEILGFTVASAEISSMGPDRYIGSVRFSGSTAVRGVYDPKTQLPGAEAGIPCFEVDEASAQNLPRFQGDGRNVWFCFTNPDEVLQGLGETRLDSVTIEIEDYETNFIPSDVYDTTRFIEVVPDL